MPRVHLQPQWLRLSTVIVLLCCSLLAAAASSDTPERGLAVAGQARATSHAPTGALHRDVIDGADIPLPVLEGIANDPNAISGLFAFDAQDASDGSSSGPSDDTNEIVSHHNASSSYYIIQLPEAFIRCHSAKVNFTFVPAPAVALKLHSLGSQADYAAWQELTIRAINNHAVYLRQLLPLKQTSWYWDPVDLGVGERFAISFSAFMNGTVGKGGHANATTPADAKVNGDKPMVLAHAVVKTNIVVSDGRPNACDADGDADPTTAPTASPTDASDTTTVNVASDGTTTLASTPASGTHHHDHNFVIIVAFLCALVGLFSMIILAFMIYKHRRARARGRDRGQKSDLGGGGPIPLTPLSGDQQAHYLGHSTWPLRDGSRSPGRSAGWAYMTRLVPGLSPCPNQAEESTIRFVDLAPVPGGTRLIPVVHLRRNNNRNRGGVVRRREAGEEDLPSYGKSEEDKKALPKYESGWRSGAEAPTRNGEGASEGQGSVASMASEGLAAIDELGEPNGRGADAHDVDSQQSSQFAPAMTTVLHYLPSSPERPNSSFETSQVPADGSLLPSEAGPSVTVSHLLHTTGTAGSDNAAGVIAVNVVPHAHAHPDTSHGAPGHAPSASMASTASRWSQWSE